jgi:DnaJ-class molecular chaperone
MAKSKKVKKVYICPTCKGNGYVKIQNIYDVELQIHQCWDCDSEGEFYVYEPQAIQPDDYVDPATGNVVKLN